MQKKSVILLFVCLLPCAVAAETQPVVKWVAPPAGGTASLNPVAPPASPFMVKAEKHFFPLSRATLRPAGLQPRQPYIEKKSTSAALPIVAAHAPPLAEGDALQAKVVHDIFDAE